MRKRNRTDFRVRSEFEIQFELNCKKVKKKLKMWMQKNVRKPEDPTRQRYIHSVEVEVLRKTSHSLIIRIIFASHYTEDNEYIEEEVLTRETIKVIIFWLTKFLRLIQIRWRKGSAGCGASQPNGRRKYLEQNQSAALHIHHTGWSLTVKMIYGVRCDPAYVTNGFWNSAFYF